VVSRRDVPDRREPFEQTPRRGYFVIELGEQAFLDHQAGAT
jgi:hypothetical protein